VTRRVGGGRYDHHPPASASLVGRLVVVVVAHLVDDVKVLVELHVDLAPVVEGDLYLEVLGVSGGAAREELLEVDRAPASFGTGPLGSPN
jgi:hypothetical protein